MEPQAPDKAEQVAALVAEGHTFATIATALGLSSASEAWHLQYSRKAKPAAAKAPAPVPARRAPVKPAPKGQTVKPGPNGQAVKAPPAAAKVSYEPVIDPAPPCTDQKWTLAWNRLQFERIRKGLAAFDYGSAYPKQPEFQKKAETSHG